MAELSKSLILYELGSAVDPPENYDISEIYKLTNKYTPTVFILPSSERDADMDGTMGK